MLSNVAMNRRGDFIVTWQSGADFSGAGSNYFGRLYSSSATPIGGQFQLNTEPAQIQFGPRAASAENRTFMAAWPQHKDGQFQLLGRNFDANANPLGLPFTISTATLAQTGSFGIAADLQGNTTAIWGQFSDANNTDSDVYRRRYLPIGVSASVIPNGPAVSGLAGSAGSWQYFRVAVPAGHSTVDFIISGSIGDADLYVRYGAIPDAGHWDGRPFLDGSNEGARMLGFPSGDWYVGINGFTSYASLSLQAVSR
jgi:hypothetical protein